MKTSSTTATESMTILHILNSSENYFENQLLKDACALIIIQIGEYVNRLSDELNGMRNVHTHHYDNVIDELVWQTIQNDIPYLEKYLKFVLTKSN